MLALILQEFDFAVETKGDLVIARLRGAEAGLIGERLEMIGRLIGYSRQIDVLMRDEGAVLARAREFVGKEPRGLDSTPPAVEATGT
jgi:pyruvate,water dikinase